MKIYTRTGDSGETGLYGGERTSKSSLRVSAYGSVDEASTFIGFARAQLNDSDLDAELVRLQSTLFELGADLDRKSTRLNSSHVAMSYAVFCLKKNDDGAQAC